MKRIATLTTLLAGALLVLALPAFAAGDTNAFDQGSMALLAAGLGLGIAAGLCGLGQGKAAASACEATARNPAAGKQIFTLAIMALAFIESLTIYSLVVSFILMNNAVAG
jgi:F-type H+-transporting ATPase subunit c